MGRKKQITDEKLIQLINEYFYSTCDENTGKLKISLIGNYVREHGYSNLNDYIIRRNEAAMNLIKELSNKKDDDIMAIVSYKNLDVDKFLNTNRTIPALKRSLTELDQYYKKISLAATSVIKKYDDLKKSALKTANRYEDANIKALELKNQINELQTQIKVLKSEQTALKTIIDTYVYPEIANELLQKSGLIKRTDHLIKQDALECNVLTPSSSIKSDSNVIQGMFRRIED